MAAGRDSRILEKLGKLEAETGSLPSSLGFYRRLLYIQSEVAPRISVAGPQLSKETATERLTGGSPLLGFDDLRIDWPLLRDTFKEIVALFASYSEVPLPAPKDSLTDAALLGAARAVFDRESLSALDGISAEWLELVLPAVLRPFLVKHSEAALHLVDQAQWRRGYCPVCGGDADFAFLDRDTGARWLMCARCDARWLFQRLECPYCGNNDQNRLAYFTEDSGLYRLYICEACRGYLKAIDLRRSEAETLLPLERFLTLDLDIQAQERGYRLPTGRRAGCANTAAGLEHQA